MTRRPARFIAVAAAGIAAATAVAVLPASPAVAAGSSTTAAALAKAQQEADSLGIKADQAVEAYDEAQDALTASTAAQQVARAKVSQSQAQLAVAKTGIQALAAAEYKSGTNSRSLVVLLSADPTTVLSEADLLAQVSRYDEANVTKVINADRSVVAAQTVADQAVAAHKAAAAAVNAREVAVKKVVNSQQIVIARLQVQEKNEVVAEAAAAAKLKESQLAASRSRARAAIGIQDPASSSAVAPAPVFAPAPVKTPVLTPVVGRITSNVAPPRASGNVAAVLAYAYAQLGKPYRWGGAGPSSFDCSGLAMRAWAAAGVSLGHSTVTQQRSGRRVSLSDLQPGDLVFWGSPAYHVGIYVGGGRILDAPHTGTDVQIQAIWGHPSSAVRL